MKTEVNEMMKTMLDKKKWAIYGVSPDESKFGYKIPLRMIEHGYEVIGVNKKYAGEEIGGMKVVSSLSELPNGVDCVDVIVNPKISLSVIEEAKKAGIEYLWFQPGTWDDQVLEKANEYGLTCVHDACVYAILGKK